MGREGRDNSTRLVCWAPTGRAVHQCWHCLFSNLGAVFCWVQLFLLFVFLNQFSASFSQHCSRSARRLPQPEIVPVPFAKVFSCDTGTDPGVGAALHQPHSSAQAFPRAQQGANPNPSSTTAANGGEATQQAWDCSTAIGFASVVSQQR